MKPSVLLDQLLQDSAAKFGSNVAVIEEDRRVTFAELDRAVNTFSEILKALKLRAGSRVGLLMENSIEYVVAYFSVLRAGLVVVPIDTSVSAATLNFVIQNCAIRVLIAHSRYRRQLHDGLNSAPHLKVLFCDSPLGVGDPNLNLIQFGPLMAVSSEGVPNIAVENEAEENSAIERDGKKHELAAIFYTSGSTGSPKGVMLSHLNLHSNTVATIEYLRLASNDKVLVILPFYYIYGNSLLLTHIGCGGALVINNMFMYPEAILNSLEEEKCTGLSGVPSNFMILLGKSTFAERELTSVRYFTQAGGAMAPEIIRKLLDAFPEKEIYIMYGQTEAAPRVTYLPPDRLSEKLGSIGIPLNGISVAIVDEHGQEAESGQAGELVVSGDNVMMGYWSHQEEEAEVLRNGKLYTGDLGYKDKDGYLYIVGRKKEIIKAGGNRVSAKEVEECLVSHGSVLEACVVGIPDELLGEAIRAYVVLKPGCDLDQKELTLHCKKKLAEHKVPKIVTFVESLPKYQSGKINRQLLKQQST